jgi:hypothetical protein
MARRGALCFEGELFMANDEKNIPAPIESVAVAEGLGKSLSAKHQIGVLNRIPVSQSSNSQNSEAPATTNSTGTKK